MQRFKSPEHTQEFLSAHAFIYGHFHPRRHQMAATAYRANRSEAFEVWRQDTCAPCRGVIRAAHAYRLLRRPAPLLSEAEIAATHVGASRSTHGIRKLSQNPAVPHVRMPDTTALLPSETETDFFNDPRTFIEGGDMFVINKDILVGVSSLASQSRWRRLAAAEPRSHLTRRASSGLYLRRHPGRTVQCYMPGLKDERLPSQLKGNC